MNVILYVVDSLRADHLSCYGYKRSTSPNLDHLAEEGILFERAFSPSTWTRPVAASLLTSVYPSTHGIRTQGHMLLGSGSWLPEMLADMGFETVGFSAMANVSRATGFARGFSSYCDLFAEPEALAKRKIKSGVDQKGTDGVAAQTALPTAEDLNERLFSWLRAREPREFFCFLWSIDPHIPYAPPAAFRQFVSPDYQGCVDGTRSSLPRVRTEEDLRQLIALYDGEIAHGDHCIGVLLDELKALGVYDETVIIITGDHGDAFNEHGRLAHGHVPYDELMRVPLVLKLPNSKRAGMRKEALVSHLDLMPTILELAGAAVQDLPLQGRSLVPLIEGTANTLHQAVFCEVRSAESQSDSFAIRTDRWKLIRVLPASSSTLFRRIWKHLRRARSLGDLIRHPLYYARRHRYARSELLFDLNEDPKETTSVAREHTELAKGLRERLERWMCECRTLRETHREWSGSHTSMDEAVEEQLRALGYIE